MKYHDIDNELIKNFLIHIDNSDQKIKSDLIDWHLALNKGDDNDCAIKAKQLIKSFVEECFPIIGVTLSEDKQDLFDIYASLENILRIAVFLREEQRIRDHLNHTIRNILFSTYLMDNIWNIKDARTRKKLILACAFHDIAYPIEKLKKVANQIINTTLGDLINSNGKIDINISDPDKLLELLDFVGNNFCIENSNILTDSLQSKIDTLYKNTIIPAIADKGIFETEHCRSSTVILLRYLIDYLDYGKKVIKNHIEDVLDICFAISYHDRFRVLKEMKNIPDIVKILRVTDELQEWDRDSLDYSYCKDVTLGDFKHNLLSFKMKDKDNGENRECDAFFTIKDKIRGIIGCLSFLKIQFVFPDGRLDIKDLSDRLENYFKKEKSPVKIILEGFDEKMKYSTVNLTIKDFSVILKGA
jgi:hypothetical protein